MSDSLQTDVGREYEDIKQVQCSPVDGQYSCKVFRSRGGKTKERGVRATIDNVSFDQELLEQDGRRNTTDVFMSSETPYTRQATTVKFGAKGECEVYENRNGSTKLYCEKQD